jgi:hypothetical protein
MGDSPDTAKATTGVDDETSGLFTGFDAYITASDDDYRHLLTDGLVVLDTNVLLNLYRYTTDAREDMFNVLDRVRDRLWIPHQVLAEFWRNRDSVLRDPRDTNKAARELNEDRERTVSTLQAWANRVSLAPERSRGLLEALDKGFETVLAAIDEYEDEGAVEAARDTSKDEVLVRLDAVLKGSCGKSLEKTAHATAIEEGLRRVEARVPPGYLDKKKGEERAAGDYILWNQVLIEAKSRRMDVLLVTGDVKEDWWRKEQGEWRGPRPELAEEMRQFAGQRLFMLRPTTFLERARTLLAITVREESLVTAGRVERFLSEEAYDLEHGGWDLKSLSKLMDELEAQASIQARAVRAAANAGGFISRDEVYELAGYADDRSLRGFTRPISRIADSLKADGVIPYRAVSILETKYGKDSPGAGWASGFEINSDVLALFGELPSRSNREDELVMQIRQIVGYDSSQALMPDGEGRYKIELHRPLTPVEEHRLDELANYNGVQMKFHHGEQRWKMGLSE